MGILVGLAAVVIPFVIVLVLISGAGIGTGYLLRWLLDIDLGTAVVSGTIAASVAFHYTGKFLTSMYGDVIDGEFADDDDDDTPTVVYLADPLTRRSRRKKKRK